MLLITGIMIGYIASSAIALLNFFATAEGVQSYMVWGLGNFGGVSLQQMPAFAFGDRCRIIRLFITDKTSERIIAGRAVCGEFGNQYTICAQLAFGHHRFADCHNHRFLRTGCIYRTCRSSYSPYGIADSQSQLLVACDYLERWSGSIALQPDLRSAR